MRTGADYRQSLRDGRRVWVMGEGQVEDVTTHPATRAMVDEYVAWYDLHLDPAWQDIAIRPPAAESERVPWAYVVPKSADDLAGMGRFFSATTFLSAGNITHTPCYGHMIALGLLAEMEVLPQGELAGYTAMGEVSLLDLGTGSLRVDPNVDTAHHHLVCSSCGLVRDIPLDVPALRLPAPYRRRFSVDSVELIFRGRCDDCNRAAPFAD